MEGLYAVIVFITANPKSVGINTCLPTTTTIYPLLTKVDMISALVAFVPKFSLSILSRRLPRLYRGGGVVNSSVDSTETTSTPSPFFKVGRGLSSLPEYFPLYLNQPSF